mmetsp:Transcript_6703/g.14655  ORF Transcript_6703/g.14655 Transcript_6703/m.14655 type:complete len:254 (+) Transcript_6703:149-910(+)
MKDPLRLLTSAAVLGASAPFTTELPSSNSNHLGRCLPVCASTSDDDRDTKSTSTYETSDSSSKGIVSSLTRVVNFLMGDSTKDGQQETIVELPPPPTSPAELLSKIRDDYEINNYLWTGDIYLSAFEEDCRFTDPTLSFTGRDNFVSNVQNLRPIVDFLIEDNGCESKLLDISLNEDEGYVQSRWNMIGNLTALPWSPRIDVIGRTKFWYNKDDLPSDSGTKVFFYDEEWEIPASKALLQLITKAGTISNSND